MVSNKNKRSSAAPYANSARRIKQADKTFLQMYEQRDNEAELLQLLTQTQQGKAYPINHRHSNLYYTLLYVACENNLPSVVKAILRRKGVDVNLWWTGSENTTAIFPIYIACRNGHIECVKLLCQAPGIDLNVESAGWGYPFGGAMVDGHRAVVEYFLNEIPDGTVDYNAISRGGSTAFLDAIGYGHKRIVKMLLEDERIDHQCRNNMTGWNAMDMACSAGSPTLIRLLEEKGFAPPTQPIQCSVQGRLLSGLASDTEEPDLEKGTLQTERRALAEDLVLGETHKSCENCNKQFKRKELKRCSDCLAVWYCGKHCQKANWKCHKPTCRKKTLKDFFDDPEGSSPEIERKETRVSPQDDGSFMEMVD